MSNLWDRIEECEGADRGKIGSGFGQSRFEIFEIKFTPFGFGEGDAVRGPIGVGADALVDDDPTGVGLESEMETGGCGVFCLQPEH